MISSRPRRSHRLRVRSFITVSPKQTWKCRDWKDLLLSWSQDCRGGPGGGLCSGSFWNLCSCGWLVPPPFSPPPPPRPARVLSDVRQSGMLKESAEAAGGRDKAPPYLHRLNSRINLSPPPLPPQCLSPPYLPRPPFSPPTFATIHLYSCHDVRNCFLTHCGFFLSLAIETLETGTGRARRKNIPHPPKKNFSFSTEVRLKIAQWSRGLTIFIMLCFFLLLSFALPRFNNLNIQAQTFEPFVFSGIRRARSTIKSSER